jgi:heme O synthase-like polyprenyltransferase
MIIISIALMAVSCVIGCCYQQMKKYGLIFLILFTVLFSLFVGIACAISKPEIVATAAGITCVVVIALTAYACI